MNVNSGNRWRPVQLAAGAMACVAIGATGAMLLLRGRAPAPVASPAPAVAAAPGSSSVIAVRLSPEVADRASLEFGAVRLGGAGADVRIPAAILPDAYGQVTVSAASAGRVLAVPVELGQVVRRGDVLVRLHSPDVADAERGLQAAQAEQTVWQRQIARLDRLVTIGAASQQELDAARAQLARLNAEVESLRAKLIQLGRTSTEVGALSGDRSPNAEVAILAPSGGTVTERLVNPGQNVGDSTALVTLVDLAAVWVVGDVYERDLARIRVGSPARITSSVFPDESIGGRVSYIDPQVAGETRTARVRVELPNPGGRLRPGMFVEMVLGEAAAGVLLVPRAAIQTIDRTDVVYVADAGQPGRFTERSVRIAPGGGEDAVVLAGLSAGERVVTRGSFLLRSERDRQHPGAPAVPPPAAARPAAGPAPSRSGSAPPDREVINVTVTTTAFAPAEITVPAGRPIRLVFTRQDEGSCATDVLIPSLNIRKALPLKQPVTIDLPPQPAGTLVFQCGMDMLRGTLVVR